jgi:hypothetical protein
MNVPCDTAVEVASARAAAVLDDDITHSTSQQCHERRSAPSSMTTQAYRDEALKITFGKYSYSPNPLFCRATAGRRAGDEI